MSFVSRAICAKCSHQNICSKKEAYCKLKDTLCNDLDTDKDDTFESAVSCKEFLEMPTVRTPFN